MNARATAAGAIAAFVSAVTAGFVSPAAAWSPAVNYAIHCQGCHLADGGATPGLVPPLAGVIGQLARVPAGRMYLVRLPNVASTPLSDRETAELMTWVVRRFATARSEAEIAPFTAEEISQGRRAPLIDIEGARRAVLEGAAAGDTPAADVETADQR